MWHQEREIIMFIQSRVMIILVTLMGQYLKKKEKNDLNAMGKM